VGRDGGPSGVGELGPGLWLPERGEGRREGGREGGLAMLLKSYASVTHTFGTVLVRTTYSRSLPPFIPPSLPLLVPRGCHEPICPVRVNARNGGGRQLAPAQVRMEMRKGRKEGRAKLFYLICKYLLTHLSSLPPSLPPLGTPPARRPRKP